MALDLPETAAEISNRAKTDVRNEIQQSAPFVRRSVLGAIISSLANRVFEFYDAVREAELEANPATASRNLLRWASAYGLTPLPGGAAAGSVFVDTSGGGSGTTIPNNTNLVSGNGAIYVTQGDVIAGAGAAAISSLTSSGTTATANTTSPHNLVSGALVTISGANESGYNLANVEITVVDADTFTYELAAATTSPATGTITASYDGALLAVQATDAGEAGNLDAGAELSFENPISGIPSSGFVTEPGIVDGSDLETNDALRTRLLDLLRNPVTLFNPAQITATALAVSGVTRVFVQESTPAIGQVTIYFMRDGDADPIPSAGEVAIVNTALQAIKPAHIADSDMIVSAPTEQSTDFIFTALSPNTASMQAAIRAQLADFFSKRTSVGVAVPSDAYRSAIFNTLDPATGDRVASFTLSAPVGTLTAAAGELRTLGTVTFP